MYSFFIQLNDGSWCDLFAPGNRIDYNREHYMIDIDKNQHGVFVKGIQSIDIYINNEFFETSSGKPNYIMGLRKYI